MGTHVVGLDIGTNAVRAVELSLGRGRPVVRHMGQVALPLGAVVAGEVVDPPAVSSAIRRLWREGGFRNRSVVVGVANARVVARMADLPSMPDDELRSSLRYQVQDLIPMPVDDAELDYRLIDHHVAEDGQELARILLVAAHRDMLRSVVAAVQGAGLSPARIDLIPFALIRALHDPAAWLDGEESHSTHEVLIGTGSGVTNVVVHHDGAPRFVRTLPMGGDAITEALAEDLELEHDAAEGIKRGIADASPAGIGALAWSPLDTLVNEVAGSIDFHLAQMGEGELRQVVLAGGGARLAALRSVLADRLGVPVLDGDPYRSVDVSKSPLGADVTARSGDLFAVAIGLALSGEKGRDNARPLNLLPTEVDASRAERRQTMLAGAGVAGFAAVLIGLSVMRGSQVDSNRVAEKAAQDKAQGLQTEVAALHDVEALQTTIGERTTTVETALTGDIAWTALFNDVATAMPDDVWLDSFSARRGDKGLPGEVQVAAHGFDQTSPAHWLLRMADIPALQAPWISSSTKSQGSGGPSTVQFNGTAKLTDAAASRRLAEFVGDKR
jgi:type IV pilus assembly protein PilM